MTLLQELRAAFDTAGMLVHAMDHGRCDQGACWTGHHSCTTASG